MNRLRALLSFLGLGLALAAGAAAPPAAGPAESAAAASASIPARERAASDRSEFRRLVLPNGIKVLLLSDPALNVSSAALAVGVGSYSDPSDRQGLAHFLEHMLFLGTAKYPDVSDFSGFLSHNGGYSNAYTAGDRTNFHLEVRHEAFEGALDRFAQFFIAPLFDARFTEREMNAVNSEHQKNLEDDLWREEQLRSHVYRRGHPANHFGTGSRATLEGTSRDELLSFYRRHYSADRMTLALTGAASLDQLEQWARRYFAPVQNRHLGPLTYPADYLRPAAALRVLRMEPIKDLRHMHLEFPLLGLNDLWPGKAPELIGFILGGEGPGSLLAALKAEGLATSLSAGAQSGAPTFGSFELKIGLTPAGLERWPRVLEVVFAAIAKLRDSGVPEHLFAERRALAQLDERYRDKGEGAARAIALANDVMDYPLEVAERVPYLWLRDDPTATGRILGALRPDNLLVTLVAKGLRTDRVEPVYGTNYSYTEDAGAAYAGLLQPAAHASIQLPRPNPFVPARTSLLPIEPVRLIDEPALVLHYAQDTDFKRPMAAYVLRLRLPRDLATLEAAVLLRYYEACLREALNETTYVAAEAGLHFSVNASLEGVTLMVEGYDEAVARLLDAVVVGLVDFRLEPGRFAALKERLLRELSAFEHIDAYQTVGETRRAAVREFYFRAQDELPLARSITLQQVRDFARRLYARGRLEAMVLGNVAAPQAAATVRRAAAALGTTGVADGDLLRRRSLASAPGEALRTSEQLRVNNSAFRRDYLLGGDDPETRAAALVLASFVGDPFYAEMRTRQQLGYIVFGGAAEDDRTEFAFFIIQSGEYPADVLEARADAFLGTLPAQLAALSEESWRTIVEGVKAKLEEKDKSIAERAQRLFLLAYDRRADWGRREATLAALERLTRARTGEILAAALDGARGRSRTFLGFAREHQPKAPPRVSFTDLATWKRSQRFE